MKCSYCGDEDGNTLDHWDIPISFTCEHQPTPARRKTIGNTIPACVECNTLLSSKLIPTIPERAAYLLDKLTRRHAALLRTPEWEDWEIEGMGAYLQGLIRKDLARKAYIEARLAYVKAIAGKSI